MRHGPCLRGRAAQRKEPKLWAWGSSPSFTNDVTLAKHFLLCPSFLILCSESDSTVS